MKDKVRRKFHQPRLDEGFTLIEIVFAFALLIVVLIPTATFLSDETVATGNLRNRVVAANLVNQMMDGYQAQGQTSFGTLDSAADQAPTSTTQKVGGITYTLTTTTRWQSTNVGTGDCDSNGNGSPATANTAVLFVEAAVSWRNMGGTPPVVAVTTIAQPFGTGSTGAGSLELAVTGASATASPNVLVSLTGAGNTYTYLTDNNGCLFVPNLTPATNYSVSLSLAGWVAINEASTASQSSITITGGQLTNVALSYDDGATIAVTYTGLRPPIGMPVTIANTLLTPDPLAPAPGTQTAIGPLYPFANGDFYWLGDCQDSVPASPPNVAPGPGTTAQVTVALQTLNLTVYDATGSPVSGATVEVISNSGLDTTPATACADTTPYQLSGMTSAAGTITAGMPLGGFTVKAFTGGTLIGTTTVVMSAGSTTKNVGTPTTTTTSTTTTTVPATTTTSTAATTTTTRTTTTTTPLG
jgi:type II secretory pathway pseudopilin PulG